MNMNLSYINEIQPYLLNELAIELMNELNVNPLSVNKLIWNNGCKCNSLKLIKSDEPNWMNISKGIWL